jgi:SAM-dependent methyltransferase
VPSKKLSLDVGCGSSRLARGTVNVDLCRSGLNKQVSNQTTGELMLAQKIPNFIVADASHLPFRDDVFDAVFSSHSIEHTATPSLAFKEMNRVCNGRVFLRCPHRKGSGAKRPSHLQYLDEDFFVRASTILGLKNEQYITTYDYPISNRTPVLSKALWQENLLGKMLTNRKNYPYRLVRNMERRFLNERLKIPFEVQSCSWRNENLRTADPVRYFVVYNNSKALKSKFMSGIKNIDEVTLHANFSRDSIPKLYNQMAAPYLNQNVWLVFCHQDFILHENLGNLLAGKDANAVYGAIGCRLEKQFFGQIKQTDGSLIGLKLGETPTPVQTLDEMCLIIHSSAFAKLEGFDSRFNFHFYGADLCMKALSSGLGVYSLRIDCKHSSRTVHGDVRSSEYLESKHWFKTKWQKWLPIRTTTGLID